MRNSTTMMLALAASVVLVACGDSGSEQPAPASTAARGGRDTDQRALEPLASPQRRPATPSASAGHPDAGPPTASDVRTAADTDGGAAGLDAIELVDTGGLKLAELAVARAVEKRQPVEPGTSFSLAAGSRIYAFMVVDNPEKIESEVAVSFAPVDGGEERGSVTVKVGAQSKWRTWAYHSHFKRPGRWIALVRNAEGEVIGRAPFELVD